MRGFLGLALVVLLVQQGWSVSWYEDFDGMPTGPITEQAGWSSTLGFGDSAQSLVSNLSLASPPNALRLPPLGPGESAKVANYDQLYYNGTGIVRISFELYRRNNNQEFQMVLARGASGRLTMSGDAVGNILLNSNATTGSFALNRFATYTVLYNFGTGYAAMELDGVQILPWTSVATTSSFLWCDQIRFLRFPRTGVTDTGNILIDDLSVQSIPNLVECWWRFEEGEGTVASEHTGTFNKGVYQVSSGTPWIPAPSALFNLYNGVDAVRDRYARQNTNVSTLVPRKSVGMITWTLELVVRLTGYTNSTLLEWASTPTPDSSGCWLKLEYYPAPGQMILRMRDDADTTGDADSPNVLGLPHDNEWHHVAFVKTSTHMFTYADYKLEDTHPLQTCADGNYTFGTGSRMHIGQDHTGGDRVGGGVGIDEIRFSSGTFLENFLRVDHPFFTKRPELLGATARLWFVDTPWVPANIHRRSNMHPGGWTKSGPFSTPLDYIGQERMEIVPMPSSKQGFYQVR